MQRFYRLLDTAGIGLILLLLLAFFSVQAEGFFSVANLSNIMVQASVIMIIATGMTFVICAAEIDLSVGSLMAMCGMITALTLRIDPESGMNLPMWFGSFVGEPYSVLWWIVASLIFLAAALLPGIIAGFISGSIIVTFGVPSFIVTLGFMMIYRGLARFLTDASPVYGMPIGFMNFDSKNLLDYFKDYDWWFLQDSDLRISFSLLLALIIVAVGHVLLMHTRFGRHVLSVGGNKQASYLSGIPVKRTCIGVFVISGMLAGIAAVVESSRLFIGDPNGGEGYELNAIAAVIIGGTSLFGGKGSVIGTLFGALIIRVLHNGMDFMDVSHHTKQIVIGGMIIFAVLLDYLRQRLQRST